MSNRKKGTYTDKLRKHIVDMAIEVGNTKRVAEYMGLGKNTIPRWRKRIYGENKESKMTRSGNDWISFNKLFTVKKEFVNFDEEGHIFRVTGTSSNVLWTIEEIENGENISINKNHIITIESKYTLFEDHHGNIYHFNGESLDIKKADHLFDTKITFVPGSLAGIVNDNCLYAL